eukprot:scaffold1368_cov333-Pavlova_lutheri.AAC.27
MIVAVFPSVRCFSEGGTECARIPMMLAMRIMNEVGLSTRLKGNAMVRSSRMQRSKLLKDTSTSNCRKLSVGGHRGPRATHSWRRVPLHIQLQSQNREESITIRRLLKQEFASFRAHGRSNGEGRARSLLVAGPLGPSAQMDGQRSDGKARRFVLPFLHFSSRTRGSLETSTPSLSAYRWSPGQIRTPAKLTGTSRSPLSRLEDLRGCVAMAFTPRSILPMSSESLMHPFTSTPLHPFLTAMAARLSPSTAHRSEPPPSTTSTRPFPGSSSAARTKGLFSKHLTVDTFPWNPYRPPRSRKMGCAICTFPCVTTSTGSGTCTSQRSAVPPLVASGGGVHVDMRARLRQQPRVRHAIAILRPRKVADVMATDPRPLPPGPRRFPSEFITSNPGPRRFPSEFMEAEEEGGSGKHGPNVRAPRAWFREAKDGTGLAWCCRGWECASTGRGSNRATTDARLSTVTVPPRPVPRLPREVRVAATKQRHASSGPRILLPSKHAAWAPPPSPFHAVPSARLQVRTNRGPVLPPILPPDRPRKEYSANFGNPTNPGAG